MTSKRSTALAQPLRPNPAEAKLPVDGSVASEISNAVSVGARAQYGLKSPGDASTLLRMTREPLQLLSTLCRRSMEPLFRLRPETTDKA